MTEGTQLPEAFNELLTRFRAADSVENQVRVLAERMTTVADRMGEIKTAGEVRDERVKNMIVTLGKVEASLVGVTAEVSDIKDMVNKGKGIGLILSGVGVTAGVFLGFWDRISKLLWPHA